MIHCTQITDHFRWTLWTKGIIGKHSSIRFYHTNDMQPRCYSFVWYQVFATWLFFYQTGSAWSMDQGSTRKRSAVYNFAPTVTKFCVMWEGQALPHDTKFGNCRCKIVGRRVLFIWPLIHGSSWSRLIKAEPSVEAHGSSCRNFPSCVFLWWYSCRNFHSCVFLWWYCCLFNINNLFI